MYHCFTCLCSAFNFTIIFILYQLFSIQVSPNLNHLHGIHFSRNSDEGSGFARLREPEEEEEDEDRPRRGERGQGCMGGGTGWM